MATLTVFNRAEEIVADGLSFTDFKRRFGRGSALIITLDCGEEILVDSCRLPCSLVADSRCSRPDLRQLLTRAWMQQQRELDLIINIFLPEVGKPNGAETEGAILNDCRQHAACLRVCDTPLLPVLCRQPIKQK